VSNMTDTFDKGNAAFIAKRYASERRFKAYGAVALAISVLFLVYLIADIGIKAWPSFFEHRVVLEVNLDASKISSADVLKGDFEGLVKDGLRAQFPEVTERSDRKKLLSLLSVGAADDLRAETVANPGSIGNTIKSGVLLSDNADLYFKGYVASSGLDEQEITFLNSLRDKGLVKKHFAWRFLTSGDSREPELAGLRGAITGSLLTLIMTLTLSVPLGIAAAVYLEEFAAKNKWTEVIEVNINNLAAVPSIIFGLLGLAVFINFFGLPRSAPLVGGLVLALLVLPTIIIASRAALKAVPPSIKEAALGVGASHQQAVFHHVLPLALPGILTGTILGVARALGETAPLLMIGMVAFIVDIPKGFTEAATVLPVQIYLWSDLPEVAFQSRTAAAIIVLLVILFCLNAVAIYLRKRFERRW
jgi:phosphate transport system permease protein